MTTEEGNKLIAYFMGHKESRDKYYGGMTDDKGDNTFPCLVAPDGKKITHVYYHSSWDWLMPVVEKINATAIPDNKFPASVHIYRSTVHVNDDYNIIIETTATREGGLILAVYQAVVQFIEWYNQSKNTQS
jgi:hypothetical protein